MNPPLVMLCVKQVGGVDLLYLEKTVSNAQKENNIQLTRNQKRHANTNPSTRTTSRKRQDFNLLAHPHMKTPNSQPQSQTTEKDTSHPEIPPAFHLDTPITPPVLLKRHPM